MREALHRINGGRLGRSHLGRLGRGWLAALMAGVFALSTANAQPPASEPVSEAALKLKDREINLLKRKLQLAQTELKQTATARLIDQAQIRVAALRGFQLKQEVAYAPLTGKILDQILKDSLARQYPGRSLDLYVWFHQRLGALPEPFDMAAALEALMGEQAAGLYDPDSKLFYVKPDFSLAAPMGQMILSHEITHALQDQNYDLAAMGVEDCADNDRATALLAIVEGDATLLMGEYMVAYSNPVSFLGDLPRMLMMDQAELNQAPLAVQQMLLFPYLEGMAFYQNLNGRTRRPLSPGMAGGGAADWRGAIFTDPPATTEQIIHPEKYLSGELPALIDPPQPTPGEAAMVNVAGEFGIRVLLEAALGRQRATQAAAGWNGDRYLLAEDEAATYRRIDWRTRWDTSTDADEFAQALADALTKQYQDGLTWKKKDGAQAAQAGPDTLRITRSSADAVVFEGRFK